MDQGLIDEILEELSSAMERVETQSAAALEFLKEKGVAKDEDLAPYLERAGNASSVRWQATRVRLSRLLSSLEKREQAEQPESQAERKQVEPEKKPEKAEAKNESQERKPANESPKSAKSDRPQETVKAANGPKRKEQREEKNEPQQKTEEKPDQQKSSEPKQQDQDNPKPADPSRAA